MTKVFLSFALVFVLSKSHSAYTQSYSKDVKSVESIMSALTQVISGSADQERDWDRFRYLFAAEAKLVPTTLNEKGELSYQYWSPEEYIKMYQENRGGTAFYEQELHRITESFGNIVHCFSTYAVRTDKDGEIERRGINSIQILKGKDRYFILQVLWSNESENEKLPARYLK